MQSKTLKTTSFFFLVMSIMLSFVGCTNKNGNDDMPINGTKLTITIQEQQFSATLIGNQTTESFVEMLPLTLNMSDLNENEKYYFLDYALPTNAFNPGTIEAGDLMLYGSSCIVLFYKTFSSNYAYTRLGKIDDPSGLEEIVGNGDVTITFELSKSITE